MFSNNIDEAKIITNIAEHHPYFFSSSTGEYVHDHLTFYNGKTYTDIHFGDVILYAGELDYARERRMKSMLAEGV